MPIYLNIEPKVDRQVAAAAARELTSWAHGLGGDMSKILGGAFSKAFAAFDTSAARREVESLAGTWRRAADVEVDAARRMEVAARRASEATEKYGADSARAMQAQAVAARGQRDYADALVANEAAHKSHSRALTDSAAAAGVAGRAWNAVGIGSLALVGTALVTATEAAGNFQASQERLVAVAGETSQNLKAVHDGVLALAGQVGFSSQELMDKMLLVEKAGYRGADAVKVLTASAQLSSEENADLGETINAVTTSLHDFHIGVDQATVVTSKLNVAVGASKVPLQDFAGALHNVEPVAAGVHENINDLYASLAMLTQSGMGADQATQNLTHTLTSLARPTKQMSDQMAMLGVDSRDIQEHFGERGLIGTANILYDAVQNKLGPSGMVMLDTWFKSAQASDSANSMMAAMAPNVRAVADEINNGTLSYAEFRKTRGGLSVEQANEIEQYKKIEDQLQGFNNNLKSGKGDIQGQIQALATLVGGQDNLRTVLQLVGENQQQSLNTLKEITNATADGDNKTKGYTESQRTYNAEMKDFKASMSAVREEMGEAFLPTMTQVAGALKTTGQFLAEHKGIAEGLTIAVGGLGTAWALTKVATLAYKDVLQPLGTAASWAFDKITASSATANTSIAAGGPAATTAAAEVDAASASEVAAQGRVRDAAVQADAALDAGGGGGKGGRFMRGLRRVGGAVPYVAGAIAIDDTVHAAAPSTDPDQQPHDWSHALFGPAADWFGARGGPVWGRGPNGIDSVLTMLAPGEHVLTHHDVNAMGGHSNVHAFRNALHRQYGGEVGPDVSVAQSMVGTPYSQGSRFDCSGAVGRVILGALGLPASNLPTTQNMGQWLSALGFRPGIGGPGAISVGWYNHGSGANDGHAAMTLSDGENAESGGSHGNFLIGAGAAGAAASEFDHHMFLGNLFGEGPGGGMPGGGGAGGFGGGAGGIPAGGVAGTGPGGQSGYYMSDPGKVQHAEDRLSTATERLATAREREAEVDKDPKAKQSARDRAHDEVLSSQRELAEAQRGEAEARRGTFHQMRGGRGGAGGGVEMPVQLPERFGLGKGLPGLAEWVVGFLEDMALGPMETAAMAGLGGGAGGGGFGTPSSGGDFGAPADLAGFAAPALGGGGGGPGVEGPAARSAASGGGTGARPWWTSSGAGGGAGGFKPWWAPGSKGAAAGAPPAAGPGIHSQMGMRMFYAGILDADGNPMRPLSPDEQRIMGGGGPENLDKPLPNLPFFSAPPGSPPPWDLNPPMITGGVPRDTPGLQGTRGPYDLPSNAPTNTLLPPLYRAQGGPSGNDTIPSWLSPGEFVESASAVQRYGNPFMDAINQGKIDPSSIQYHDPGGPTTPEDVHTQGPPPPAPKPQQPGQQGQKPGAGKGPLNIAGPAPTADATPPGAQTRPGLAQPGESKETFGQELPASQGIGFSGGAIGAAEGAASSAGDLFAPGSGAAMQVAFQMLNRTAAYGAQAAGIGVEGLLETFLPSNSPLSNFANTVPGKLLAGVSGVRPQSPNSAGQTKPPLTGDEAGAGQGGGSGGQGGDTHQIGVQMNGVNIHTNNADDFHNQLSRDHSAAVANYPFRGGP